MKRLFVQLLQWNNRYKKRLIYGALALLICQICFFNLGGLGIDNVTYAVDSNNSTLNAAFQEKATGWLEDLSFLERGCYILLYPILILAGALVNNSWVYAEIFSFDAVLWQLWNIVRNLANFALGFILVFKIFQYLIDEKKAGKLKDILTSTLIAGIGIQASWFLLAVLIDISNVLTYSVGGLPIHILGTQDGWDNKDFGNPYVFQTVVSVDFADPDSMYFYLSNTSSGSNLGPSHSFISECETFSFNYDGKSEELIVAPKMIYYTDGKNYYETEKDACHVGDDVFYFGGFAQGIAWQGCSDKDSCKNGQNTYKDSVDKAIKELKQKDKGGIEGDMQGGKVMQIKNAHGTGDDIWVHYGEGSPYGLDVDNKKSGEKWGMKRLHDILEGDDGYVGVFSALYSSLLNAGKVFSAYDTGIYVSLLSKMLSFCHTLAVGLPLVAMLLVFVMRIGVIWVAIILSPMIILLSAFKVGSESLMDKVAKNVKVLKYFTIENLALIIFSPAIICFAVSISTVLVRIITTVNAEHVMTEKTSILGGLIELNLAGLGVNLGKLICSVIGIAISWFLIWSAIKASELGKSEIISGKNGLKGIIGSALGSIPIVPIPTKKGGIDFVGARTAFGGDGKQGMLSKWRNNIINEYDKQDQRAVSALFGSDNSGQTSQEAVANQVHAYMRGLSSMSISDIKGGDWRDLVITIGANRDTPKKFSDFNDSEKDSIIKAINEIGDENLRKAFGESKSSIPVGSAVYNFDGNSNQYVQQTNAPSSS